MKMSTPSQYGGKIVMRKYRSYESSSESSFLSTLRDVFDAVQRMKFWSIDGAQQDEARGGSQTVNRDLAAVVPSVEDTFAAPTSDSR